MATVYDSLAIADNVTASMTPVAITTLLSGTKGSNIINQTVTEWRKVATSSNASGCVEILASPGSGNAHVIEKLEIYIGAAITVTIGSGKSGSAVENDKIGPIGGAVGYYPLDFNDEPVQLTANKSLTFDASGAGSVCIIANGYTRET